MRKTDGLDVYFAMIAEDFLALREKIDALGPIGEFSDSLLESAKLFNESAKLYADSNNKLIYKLDHLGVGNGDQILTERKYEEKLKRFMIEAKLEIKSGGLKFYSTPQYIINNKKSGRLFKTTFIVPKKTGRGFFSYSWLWFSELIDSDIECDMGVFVITILFAFVVSFLCWKVLF